MCVVSLSKNPSFIEMGFSFKQNTGGNAYFEIDLPSKIPQIKQILNWAELKLIQILNYSFILGGQPESSASMQSQWGHFF